LLKLKYEAIEKLSKDEIKNALVKNDAEELSRAVLSAALYCEDSDFAENICLQLAHHEHFNVRGNAILGFGNIARIDRKLNENRVKPIIENALKDANEFVRGQANDAKDEIEYFLKWKFSK